MEQMEAVVETAAKTATEGIEKISTMAGVSSGVVIALLAAVVILVFKKPIRLIFKLAINTGLGFVALIIINKIGVPLGLSLGINWLNAIVVGVLGIPGVALLLVLKWMMII